MKNMKLPNSDEWEKIIRRITHILRKLQHEKAFNAFSAERNYYEEK